MRVNMYLLGGLLASSLVFIGCSSSEGDSADPVLGATTVTAVDGYIRDANIIDNVGQIGVYTSSGRYAFANSIAYPLRSSGGALEDTNASFDINMSAQSGLVLSPITSFLGDDSGLLDKLIGLGISDATTLNGLAVDYIDTNSSDLAKLSQLLYLVQKDSDLLSAFKASLADMNPANLSELFVLAQADVNATMGAYAVTYNAFLVDVLNLTVAPSEYETQLESDKAALFEIQYNGTTYGTVTSPYTQRVWLDRNLGANQICTALDDVACYGDYYQWGRNFDGHQESNSTTMTTLSYNIDDVGHPSLIVTTTSPDDWTATAIDDNGTLRVDNWGKSDGTSVCPVGFRVPTISELQNETADPSATVVTNIDAFNNFLKLPSAGYRWYGGEATVNYQGVTGVLWANTPGNVYYSRNFIFFSDHTDYTNTVGRANGFSVRCIEDIENQAPIANAGIDKNVTIGAAVNFSAYASSDVDGSIIGYEWKEGDTILSASGSFTKSDFSAGVHTITLTVTDNDGATSADTVVVTVGIVHNGILYGSVTSPYTGKIWLDRNLGASQVCTALDDTACYGLYYQWGRNADGHQELSSVTTTTLATDVNDAGSSFITNNTTANNDWAAASVDDNGALRAINWSKTDGSSVCPAGYRVPTITELTDETTAASTPVANSTDAYSNFLKLPSAGSRDFANGLPNNQSYAGLVWSSSVTPDNYAYHLDFGGTFARTTEYNRYAYGFSVRCVKEEPNIALNKSVTALTNVVSGASTNVVDGSYSTVWYSYQGSPSTISFVVDLGSSFAINKISFLPSQTRNYTIESSTDNENWTTQSNVTGIDFYGSTAQDITINPTYNARYLRYTGTNGNSDDADVGVVEFEVYGESSKPD